MNIIDYLYVVINRFHVGSIFFEKLIVKIFIQNFQLKFYPPAHVPMTTKASDNINKNAAAKKEKSRQVIAKILAMICDLKAKEVQNRAEHDLITVKLNIKINSIQDFDVHI